MEVSFIAYPWKALDSMLQLLQEAEVVLGGDGTGNEAQFYGRECLSLNDTAGRRTVYIFLEAGKFHQQAEELRKIVDELKGTTGCKR